ncbi:mevalonate kinase [Sediminivirga luteola]|jgi:mevalonate kinase|uniref:mevalonate kinase n=1 Tax=Sediminivirga luteola TaxID=1774748 RepID=A0A8J2TV46_9MICO|nr:mevalonate kinase [Sediminivirga luteola]
MVQLSRAIDTQDPSAGHGRAHAKVILFGEHAVVYGYPAIAVPLHGLSVYAQAAWTSGPSRVDSSYLGDPATRRPGADAIPLTAVAAARAHFGLEPGIAVDVDSAVPPGRGLGSSAATSTAIVRAIADLAGVPLGEELCFELVQHAERVAHGTPSGLDARATAAEGPIRFQSGSAHRLGVRTTAHFLVADTGVHGNTRSAVADVRAHLTAHPQQGRAALERLGAISGQVEQVFGGADGVTQLGDLMNEAQELLAGLGVSSKEIDRLATAGLAAGGLGAKLSGGGQGGCVVVLLPGEEASATVEQALREAGAAGIYRFDTRMFQP